MIIGFLVDATYLISGKSINSNDAILYAGQFKSSNRSTAVKSNGEMIDDFLIISQNNIINVCNAPSPAATASFAIGEHISNLIK